MICPAFCGIVTLLITGCWAEGATEGSKPHVVLMLIDDWGWANIGYHNEPFDVDGATAVMDSIANEGIKLEQHYTHLVCGPTRASLLSGRIPSNVNIDNGYVTGYSDEDPVAGGAGIPPNMTTVASKLKEVGYATHAIGKWDAGMATPEQVPSGRGFDSSLVLFNHMNNMYTMKQNSCPECGLITDLWENNGPATSLVGTGYEEDIFRQRLLDIVVAHDSTTPLFLYYPARHVHTPLQVPKNYEEMFSHIENDDRRLYYAMLKHLDDTIGLLKTALVEKNMWEDTLFIGLADNGGPLYELAGASNFPLRGGKLTNWQGGVRTLAFVGGGAVPTAMRGQTIDEYFHVCDWYSTLCYLAGVDPTDTLADSFSDLRPIDSINMWPLLSGQTTTSERNEIFLAPLFYLNREFGGYGLISGDYKIMMGNAAYNILSGPRYPSVPATEEPKQECGDEGCLYNIKSDPREMNELSNMPQLTGIKNALRERAEQLHGDMYLPLRGMQPHPDACVYAIEKYCGYWGPFVGVPPPVAGECSALPSEP